MKEIMSNPEMGRVVMEGLKDTRWQGWAKMQYTKAVGIGTESTKIVIHYVAKFENGIMQAIDDFKFK